MDVPDDLVNADTAVDVAALVSLFSKRLGPVFVFALQNYDT